MIAFIGRNFLARKLFGCVWGGGERHNNVHWQKQGTSQVLMCVFDLLFTVLSAHETLRDLIPPQ